jgi:hypothetical protein
MTIVPFVNVEIYRTTGRATDGNTVRRMLFACWVTKATSRHSEYVILIAFPRQQWYKIDLNLV